jgi:hypothetical protein
MSSSSPQQQAGSTALLKTSCRTALGALPGNCQEVSSLRRPVRRGLPSQSQHASGPQAERRAIKNKSGEMFPKIDWAGVIKVAAKSYLATPGSRHLAAQQSSR